MHSLNANSDALQVMIKEQLDIEVRDRESLEPSDLHKESL